MTLSGAKSSAPGLMELITFTALSLAYSYAQNRLESLPSSRTPALMILIPSIPPNASPHLKSVVPTAHQDLNVLVRRAIHTTVTAEAVCNLLAAVGSLGDLLWRACPLSTL